MRREAQHAFISLNQALVNRVVALLPDRLAARPRSRKTAKPKKARWASGFRPSTCFHRQDDELSRLDRSRGDRDIDLVRSKQGRGAGERQYRSHYLTILSGVVERATRQAEQRAHLGPQHLRLAGLGQIGVAADLERRVA